MTITPNAVALQYRKPAGYETIWRKRMPVRFASALLIIGLSLTGCTKPQAARTTPPLAGTAAGACEDPMSAAARDRAGSGCPATATQGSARIAGCDVGGPQVAYRGTPMGTVGDQNRRMGQYGMQQSCP
ncbi:hypothetical protein [Roseicella aquatilis]|uniref:Uncharacterized protein n=1 Tax=Roseicella aquatilis TaxID=2527868 RepID=A0A4R4D3G2_9PROT|nr:hypothetical protein [Roseicella aquatilis]TCZ51565.1 hypothetical protein EXY23_26820 [Roseicella aquatilis]